MFATLKAKLLAALAFIGAAIIAIAYAFFKGRSQAATDIAAESNAEALKVAKHEQHVDTSVAELVHSLPVAPVTPEAPAVVLDAAPANTSQGRLNMLSKGDGNA